MYSYTAPIEAAEAILDTTEFKGGIQAVTTNYRTEITVIFDRSDDLETFVRLVDHVN